MSPAGVTSTFHGPKSRCSGTAGRAPRALTIASPFPLQAPVHHPAEDVDELGQHGLHDRLAPLRRRTRRFPRRERGQPVGDFRGPGPQTAACEQCFERAPDNRGLAQQRHAAGLAPDEQPGNTGDAAEAARRQVCQRIALPTDAGGCFVHARGLDGHQGNRARLGEGQQHDLADAARPAGHEQRRQPLGCRAEPPVRPAIAQPGRWSKLAGSRSARPACEDADPGSEAAPQEIAHTPAALRDQPAHPTAAQSLPCAHVRRSAPRAHGHPEHGRGTGGRPRAIAGDVLEASFAKRALDAARSADARVPFRVAGAARRQRLAKLDQRGRVRIARNHQITVVTAGAVGHHLVGDARYRVGQGTGRAAERSARARRRQQEPPVDPAEACVQALLGRLSRHRPPALPPALRRRPA